MARAKNTNNLRRKFPWKITTVVVLLLVVGGVAWRVDHTTKTPASGIRPTNTVNYSPPTPSENTTGNDRKSSSSPATTLDNGATTQNTTSTTFTDTIVNAAATSTNVHVGTLVSGTTAGSCTLTASMTGQTSIVRTSVVQQDVNSYDCGVFNIPTTDFTANGTWALTLTVSNDGQQASATSSVAITSNG